MSVTVLAFSTIGVMSSLLCRQTAEQNHELPRLVNRLTQILKTNDEFIELVQVLGQCMPSTILKP